ncbi:MAG TPA: hypothetical protein VGF67_27190 [Ktedonobacteraceae bacterium]|jgi:hypothetical protein
MNEHSSFSYKRPDGDKAQGRSNVFERAARAWLRLSGPRQRCFSASLEDQKRLQRSQILSTLFPLIFLAILITAPTALLMPTYWLALSTLLVMEGLALLLNRAAWINLGSLFVIFGIDSALIILMVTQPAGIRNSTIPDIDLFLIPTLIGGIVLPRRLIPCLALFHIALIAALFAFFPRDILVLEEIRINQHSLASNEISDAWLLQIIGALIAWLNACSIEKALLRASKAEDLVQVQSNLQEHMRRQREQEERLTYGIALLKEAHVRFSHGDLRVRAHLQDNELAALATSFNRLVERLNRVAQAAQEYLRLEQAFQQLFAIQNAVIYQSALPPLPPTGTLIDRIYPWLKQYHQLRQVYMRFGTLLEKVHLTLARQRTLLMQLTSTLDQTHARMRLGTERPGACTNSLDALEKAQQLCMQIEEQSRTCAQETRQLDQLLKI